MLLLNEKKKGRQRPICVKPWLPRQESIEEASAGVLRKSCSRNIPQIYNHAKARFQ